jgi:hypothetical protein
VDFKINHLKEKDKVTDYIVAALYLKLPVAAGSPPDQRQRRHGRGHN